MPKRSMRSMIAPILLLTLLLPFAAACSSKEDKAAAESLANRLENGKFGKVIPAEKISKKQATCVSEGWVSDVGVDDLTKGGLLDKDGTAPVIISAPKLNKSAAPKAAKTIAGCMDLKKQFVKTLDNTQPPLPDEVKSCVSKALTERRATLLVETALRGTMSKKPTGESKKLNEALTKCSALAPGNGQSQGQQ